MLLPLNYKKLPVEELIALMADKTQEQRFIDRAIREFHSRYAAYAYTVAIKTASIKCIFDESEITTIVHNSLLSIYAKVGVYNAAAEGSSELQKHKRICGWVGVITRNAAIIYAKNQDKLKKKIILTENIDDYADIVNEIEDAEIPESMPTPERLLLEEGISRLSERDWDVTSTYLSYEDEKGDIPTEVLDRLNKRHNLLPKYANKITNRTVDKLFSLNPIVLKLTDNDEKDSTKRRREKIREETTRLPPRDWQDDSADTGTG